MNPFSCEQRNKDTEDEDSKDMYDGWEHIGGERYIFISKEAENMTVCADGNTPDRQD